MNTFTIEIDDKDGGDLLMWNESMDAKDFAAAAASAQGEINDQYLDHMNVRWERAEIIVSDGWTAVRFPIKWIEGNPVDRRDLAGYRDAMDRIKELRETWPWTEAEMQELSDLTVRWGKEEWAIDPADRPKKTFYIVQYAESRNSFFVKLKTEFFTHLKDALLLHRLKSRQSAMLVRVQAADEEEALERFHGGELLRRIGQMS